MSDYNVYANNKFIDEYAASKLSAINNMDILDEKRKKLEAHIIKFQSNFDNTSIGKQLRDAGIEVSLWAEIRDVLWKNYQKAKDEKVERERFLLELRQKIDEVL